MALCLLRVHQYPTLAMRMSQVKFEPYDENDNIEDYCERLELFFTTNEVVDEKKVAHLLSGLGTKTYAVLKNLTAPETPLDCSLARIKEALINHFKPKPPVIAERFIFHKRDQHTGEGICDRIETLSLHV